MAIDVFQTVKDCRQFAEARGTSFKKEKSMNVFRAKKPLEFIDVDLQSFFQDGKQLNRHSVISDRLSKLAEVNPLSSTTAVSVAKAFLENCITPYSMPTRLLTDNGPQISLNSLEEFVFF